MCIGQAEDRKFFRKLPLDCLVLDEGHMLKNMSSQRYAHLMKIRVSGLDWGECSLLDRMVVLENFAL